MNSDREHTANQFFDAHHTKPATPQESMADQKSQSGGQVGDATTSNTSSHSAGDANQLVDQSVSAEQNPASSTQGSTPEVEALHQQIAKLEQHIKEAKEAQARANAEAYNAQKRMEQETEKTRKFALQKFVKELLEVVDNLERAIESVQPTTSTNQAITPANQAILEGIELTHKSLLAILSRQGVEVVNPVGEKFNPDFHEAVGVFPDAPPDIVGLVLQKGYTLNGRTIRPAMVQVGA